jgi:hypothetical protein
MFLAGSHQRARRSSLCLLSGHRFAREGQTELAVEVRLVVGVTIGDDLTVLNENRIGGTHDDMASRPLQNAAIRQQEGPTVSTGQRELDHHRLVANDLIWLKK